MSDSKNLCIVNLKILLILEVYGKANYKNLTVI